MGMFSRSTPDSAEVAADLRADAKTNAKGAAVAKAVGAGKVSNHLRREAAQENVVARYYESGRCQLGHINCAAGDH